MPRKKEQRVALRKQLFFKVFRKVFRCRRVQRLSGDTGSNTVAGKNTVLYFKEIGIRRMTRYKNTIDCKTGNRQPAITPQCFAPVTHKAVISRIHFRIINFQQCIKAVGMMMLRGNTNARYPIVVLFNMVQNLSGYPARIDDERLTAYLITDKITVHKTVMRIMRVYLHCSSSSCSK